jgi:hypothetical protein
MPRMLRIVGRSSGKNYRRLRGPVSPSTALRDAQRHVTSGLGTPIVSIAVPHRMRGRVEVNPRRSSLNATAHRRRLTTPHAFHFCLKYPLGVRGGEAPPAPEPVARASRAEARRKTCASALHSETAAKGSRSKPFHPVNAHAQPLDSKRLRKSVQRGHFPFLLPPATQAMTGKDPTCRFLPTFAASF